MAKQYTEDDLGILVAGDWSLVNSEGAEAKPGVGVRATQREQPGPWNYPREMVLPFPFTLNQFRDFCDWHTYFQWEVIEAQYLNDDGSLDEDALAELAQRGEDAAELVRRYLTGETDAEKAAGPPPTVDRAEAREAPPTGQQDAPERSSSEEDSGESRAGEVHPDALAKAIATEVVQQLLKPDDAPAAPDGTQQDAPGSNDEEDNSGNIRAGEVLDYAMLASPQRLIDTFGNFTGMNSTWFFNLTDKPALMRARKVEGHSGRNSSPPLFCPFEVMNWLTSAKRKTGRPISTEKAWELLEGSFPKVYNKHSVADPRED